MNKPVAHEPVYALTTKGLKLLEVAPAPGGDEVRA